MLRNVTSMLKPMRTETRTCATHGDYTASGMHIAGALRWGGCPECEAEQERADQAIRNAEREQYRRESGFRMLVGNSAIPARFSDRTLDSYRAESADQKRALAVAKGYSDEFDVAMQTGRSLVLCGLPGTGKTHLAIGCAHAVMATGRTALFTTTINAIRRVRETYRRDSTETEREVIRAFTVPDLLILDEVGQQHGTDAEKVTIFDLINARYEAMRPMIVISNLSLQGIREYLGERAFDRLREGGGQAVTFTWESYRK